MKWFETAVFYEVPVYAFRDSNGDGVGDFAGLTEKLDYLQWLGIDCLWLTPFYGSPRKDGGYDVSDYAAVDPRYGSMDDVRAFVDGLHERGMRVIADLPINHTSDAHPWFQEARRPGSATRDWYVWTDDPDQWSEARVIFTDTHDSNWTWDDEAGAYYWHRFFWHQPDLNFDNPDVRRAVEDVVRFWLDVGFDGLRLDAIPYLYERDGTNGENLPETHAYLKEIRAMVDSEYEDRILLAEANQWPHDVVEYFGDGDECHMAFHFPVMPRLFMAVATGDATPIVDILARTPAIPDDAQWGIFLRNHDELTLEMVTEEERAFLYETYAPEPTMRKNVGIRRRLAPLLGGDRRKIELLTGLLLSLPGSPFLYYGDEIGMGDIHTLEDRDGVRTPMQWDSSPGTGFSDADSLYLPVVDSPGFAPEDVNVAAAQADDGSLLHAVRRLLRSRPALFGTGRFEPVEGNDPRVFSFRRVDDSGEVLVVANLSADTVTIDVAHPSTDLITAEPVGSELEPYRFVWARRP
ncbi:MAG: maltose alpha-D-glucosyltransferase [Acidimicrobiia bacterium]|nr:maltose alpha-D-glucosyltransferase [Acidimicrobiia bacterium]